MARLRPCWVGTRFRDDGRKTITPLNDSGFTFGIDTKVRVATAQETIIQFHRRGYSEIYDVEYPIWVVFEYCKIKGLKYHIRDKRVYITKCQGRCSDQLSNPNYS